MNPRKIIIPLKLPEKIANETLEVIKEKINNSNFIYGEFFSEVEKRLSEDPSELIKGILKIDNFILKILRLFKLEAAYMNVSGKPETDYYMEIELFSDKDYQKIISFMDSLEDEIVDNSSSPEVYLYPRILFNKYNDSNENQSVHLIGIDLKIKFKKEENEEIKVKEDDENREN